MREVPLRTGAVGLLLVELAGIEESLRERDAVWKDLIHRLEGLRHQIVVAGAANPKSRSPAVLKKPRENDADQRLPQHATIRDVARADRLTKEFEAAQRDAEQRRLALHAEMGDLRRRQQAILRRLPLAISRAYQSLLDGGPAPATAAVANGACGGCQAALPEFVLEAVSQGDVVACARCERLLRPARPVE